MGKSTNVECEDNFARATSSRAYMRGKTHMMSTMCAKHYTSEVKEVWRKSFPTQQKKREAIANAEGARQAVFRRPGPDWRVQADNALHTWSRHTRHRHTRSKHKKS